MHTSIDRSGIDFRTPGLNFLSNVRADAVLWMAALLPPLLLMTIVAMQPWVEAADLLRDPLAVAELKGVDCCKVYYGLVSNTGVVLWMACAAICLFAAAVLASLRGLAPETISLFAAGLFTGLLGADDLFLVHENVLPAFGVPQPVTYGAYGLIACGYLALSWRSILNNNVLLLMTAIALLGISVGIDWVIHSEEPWRIIVEDGAKITGICAWGAFHVTAAWRALTAGS